MSKRIIHIVVGSYPPVFLPDGSNANLIHIHDRHPVALVTHPERQPRYLCPIARLQWRVPL